MFKVIIVIGGNGAIGFALTKKLSKLYPDSVIYSFSRDPIKSNFNNVFHHTIDYSNEVSIEESSKVVAEQKIDLVIVATGFLHNEEIKPEKSVKELSRDKFQHLFEINTILPAIIAKYFIPRLSRNNTSIFAVLSARIGSISGNYLGGWYSYRASKAALNMIIKNLSIETSRNNKYAIIVGLNLNLKNNNIHDRAIVIVGNNM